MEVEKQYDFAVIFKALGDSTRLKILEMLSCGELCACDILEAFEITQPTLSYHMKSLTESGLVIARKEVSWTRYGNNEEVLNQVMMFCEKIMEGQDDCICKEGNAVGKCVI